MKPSALTLLSVIVLLLLPSSLLAASETRYKIEAYQVQTGTQKVQETVIVKEPCQVKIGDKPIYETRSRSVYLGQAPIYGCWPVADYGCWPVADYGCWPVIDHVECGQVGAHAECGVVGSYPVYGTESYQVLVGSEAVYETRVCDVPKQVLVEKPVYETRYKQVATQVEILTGSGSSAKSGSSSDTITRCY